MTKPDLISILKLLSALESWSFAQNVRMPDYLYDQISCTLASIEAEILKDKP